MKAAARSLHVLLFVTILICPASAQSLSGTLSVNHSGYADFRFVKSYVYIFELNEYIEVALDGSFLIEDLPEGRYSFKTFVPGFEPSYRTIQFPEQQELTIGVELQRVAIETVNVDREVPAYLKNVRSLVDAPEVTAEQPKPTPSPLPPMKEGETQGVSVNKFIDSLRNLFRRNRDKDEK